MKLFPVLGNMVNAYAGRVALLYKDDVLPPKNVKDLPRAMRETVRQTVRYFFAPVTALFRE